jgi:hypothetical protein
MLFLFRKKKPKPKTKREREQEETQEEKDLRHIRTLKPVSSAEPWFEKSCSLEDKPNQSPKIQ